MLVAPPLRITMTADQSHQLGTEAERHVREGLTEDELESL